jgi:hypothetical protein
MLTLNIKSKQKLAIALLFSFLAFGSCDDPGSAELPAAGQPYLDRVEKNASIAQATSVACDISGPSTIPTTATIETFSYFSDLSNPAISWSVVQGPATIQSPTSATTDIIFGAGTGDIILRAEGISGLEVCTTIVTIKRSKSGTPVCTCPDPKITISDPDPTNPNVNCNVKSNGIYGVSLIGKAPGDVLEWSGNSNVNLQNGQGTSELAFYIIDINQDFTIQCKVTRTCANGSKFIRIARYGSNVSQSCQHYAQYADPCVVQ